MQRVMILLVLSLGLLTSTGWAYSGGTGEPNDPYQIATAQDLIDLGNDPCNYDKCFVLIADIDLSGYTFDRAVIAPDVDADESDYQGTEFGGFFDGRGHVIHHLQIEGKSYLGLFGICSSGAVLSHLCLEVVDVNGNGVNVGGLVGENDSGMITTSYSTGSVNGSSYVGGLVGNNDKGTIASCYSTGNINGSSCVGGLVGENNQGTIVSCYSTGMINSDGLYVGGFVGENDQGIIASCYSTGNVSGSGSYIGGLVGENDSGMITASYSTGAVHGDWSVGGLVGENGFGTITSSYSTGNVRGQSDIGGLVGENFASTITSSYSTGKVSGDQDVGGLVGWSDSRIWSSFWDTNTSGCFNSDGGIGLSTTRMQNVNTFLDAGWDFVNETAHGICNYWTWQQGSYPSLAVFSGNIPAEPNGAGTADNPYLLTNANDLASVWYRPWSHYRLDADVDLVGMTWNSSVISGFSGHFDGHGHLIHHLQIMGGGCLGLFGFCSSGATISNLGLTAIDVKGSENYIGGLVARNSGTICSTYSTGSVSSSAGDAGGLVGWNQQGTIRSSYSTVSVKGSLFRIAGLVGWNNYGTITLSYSTGTVNSSRGSGLVGENYHGMISSSCWDIETSGWAGSDGGVGLTTTEMKDAEMLGLNGWAADPNWVLNPGGDYPRLVWEGTKGQPIPAPVIDWISGTGIPEDPYQINTVSQLVLISKASLMSDRSFVLTNSLDLSGQSWSQAIIPYFNGRLDGHGFVISHIYINGQGHVGFFGKLGPKAEVINLGLEAVDISGTAYFVGGLVGENTGTIDSSYSSGVVKSSQDRCGGFVGYNDHGTINSCYSTGSVAGGTGYEGGVGGLVGENDSGTITSSYSTDSVSGHMYVGGLVGHNYYTGTITTSYSTGNVDGSDYVGGLAGANDYSGMISMSYSIGSVSGEWSFGGIGGFVGENAGMIMSCYSTGSVSGWDDVGGFVGHSWSSNVITSFWDMETSGQTKSRGGTGLTTAQMQDPNTFLNAGWDLVGERINGTHNYWQMQAGSYPTLAPPVEPNGTGTLDDPYLITDANELGVIWIHPQACYRLEADIDLAGVYWNKAVVPWFGGGFDGGDHVIRNLYIEGTKNLGLFGELDSRAIVSHLTLETVVVNGTGNYVGSLAGDSHAKGIISCHSTGTVRGHYYVGGLVGYSYGTIYSSYMTGSISGSYDVGGLVGCNNEGTICSSYSTGSISADWSYVGGLVGANSGTITSSYSNSNVIGEQYAGGLVGNNGGMIVSCYSTGSVSCLRYVGGLVGRDWSDTITFSFWDITTSGKSRSAGGTGLTTAEMQDIATYLNAGWDFVGETANGIDDLWIMPENDYPRLWWQGAD